MDEVILGIDVGTQGARTAAFTADGRPVAQSSRPFARIALPGLPPGHLEQEPEDWWLAVRACLQDTVQQLVARGIPAGAIRAGAVDSTSGTILLLDSACRPLRPALLYNDRRAQAEAEEINQAAEAFCRKAGYRFHSSYALAKALWLARHEPQAWERAAHLVHAADYIVGRLTGIYHITDQSNALKTGYDLLEQAWPEFIPSRLGLDLRRFPEVRWSGETIGRVSQECADTTGLPSGMPIVAGMTDGSADQIASGACRPGDWNTVLGTTLVLKGLTRQLLRDPSGRFYCHRHPRGWWMPGGASNVGARVLDEWFADRDRAALDACALSQSPTALTVYPLLQRGERFPFVCPEATGFSEGTARSEEERYTACLEGIACLERLAYETAQNLGAEVGGRIYTTGGGSNSAAWRQIRADVLGREIARAAHSSAAMGSTILAASRILFSDVSAAIRAMVRLDSVVSPRPAMLSRYEESYRRFTAALLSRGYLVSEEEKTG